MLRRKLITSMNDVLLQDDEIQKLFIERAKEIMPNKTTITNIYSVYNKELKDTCWTYNENYDEKQYSNFSITIPEFNIKIFILAHVVSCIIKYNKIPDNSISENKICVSHLCKNKFCVNPNHLIFASKEQDWHHHNIHRNIKRVKESGIFLNKDEIKKIRYLYWVKGLEKREIYSLLNLRIHFATFRNLMNFKSCKVLDYRG